MSTTDDRGRNAVGGEWVTDMEKSEGGTGGTMFQFRTMAITVADRAPATGTGEMEPFVWVDIHGQREDGTDDTMTLRLDKESAEGMSLALSEVLAWARELAAQE
ncbi:MAG: hypothetical protein ACYCZN_01750 [Candidatus Dormibacteria bacterium]